MRRLAAIALLAALPAYADAAEHADPQDAQPTAVTARLAGTRIHLTARFAFEIDAPGTAAGALAFVIPPRAVVTAGTAIVNGARHRLRLEKAETARRAFDALTLAPADGHQRAWAFVIDVASGLVTVDTLAARRAHVVLELALDAQTCFYNDARYVELPASWWAHLPAAPRTRPHVDDQEVTLACGDRSDDNNHWFGLASRHLRAQPAGERRIGTIAGMLPIEATHFAQVEIDLARELGDVPGDLHTVIVLDHSRSLRPGELEAERAIVAAYVRAAPASHVQVIAFARRAAPLLASWMIASRAAPQLDRAIRALPPRNGSNLDVALGEAAAWLARVHGTRRIVIIGDERLPARLDPDAGALASLIPTGVLVHAVAPVPGGGLVRDDDAVLAPLAAATQGIAASGGPEDDGSLDAMMLVRPTSLDRLTIGGSGWEMLQDPVGCTDSLTEGRACTWWAQSDGGGGPITIAGRVWNRPFERVVRADPSRARELARTLSVLGVLDRELQTQVDRVARAVSSVWSLFGRWGGDGGYEDLGGYGTFGTGRFSTTGGVTDTIGVPVLTRHEPDVRPQLAPAVARCGAGAVRVAIEIETTGEEIVAVEVRATPADAALEACIAEAVWDTTLRIADPPAHAMTHVVFGT